jgi:hypothetical protein
MSNETAVVQKPDIQLIPAQDAAYNGIPSELADCDTAQVLAATDGFTGADVKRLVQDAKGFYAFDRAMKNQLRSGTVYLIEAAEAVRENKQRYERAQLAAQARPQTSANSYYYPPPTEDD